MNQKIRELGIRYKKAVIISLNCLTIFAAVLFYSAGMYDRIVLAAFTIVYINTILKNSFRSKISVDYTNLEN